MFAYILVESTFDASLLLHILDGPDLSGIEIRATSAVYSLARTFLAGPRTPVALVLDSHSAEPEVAARRQQEAVEALSDVSPKTTFRVIVVSPELEILFFLRPEILRRLFGEAVTDHVIELARYSARSALHKLDPSADYEQLRWRVLRSMTAEDITALRQSDVARALIQFTEWARRRSLSVV